MGSPWADNPLRETVTLKGPINLQDMFEVSDSVIAASSSVGAPTGDPPAHSAMEQRPRLRSRGFCALVRGAS
jgi:hypothetical protein